MDVYRRRLHCTVKRKIKQKNQNAPYLDLLRMGRSVILWVFKVVEGLPFCGLLLIPLFIMISLTL